MKEMPGSIEAIEKGCVCPILDNAHGRGAYGYTIDGKGPCFWVTNECPLHGGIRSSGTIMFKDEKESPNG